MEVSLLWVQALFNVYFLRNELSVEILARALWWTWGPEKPVVHMDVESQKDSPWLCQFACLTTTLDVFQIQDLPLRRFHETILWSILCPVISSFSYGDRPWCSFCLSCRFVNKRGKKRHVLFPLGTYSTTRGPETREKDTMVWRDMHANKSDLT